MNRDYSNKIEWIPKGWGGEQLIVNNEKYCSKILCFMKNHKCSAHFHENKDETLYLLSGRLLVYCSDDVKVLERVGDTVRAVDIMDRYELLPGDKFHIPPNRVHQLVALEESKVLETSTQDLYGDDYSCVMKGD